jgi:hypothetical protein
VGGSSFPDLDPNPNADGDVDRNGNPDVDLDVDPDVARDPDLDSDVDVDKLMHKGVRFMEKVKTTLILDVEVTYSEDGYQAVIERVTIEGTGGIIPLAAIPTRGLNELHADADEDLETKRGPEWEERRRLAEQQELRLRDIDRSI